MNNTGVRFLREGFGGLGVSGGGPVVLSLVPITVWDFVSGERRAGGHSPPKSSQKCRCQATVMNIFKVELHFPSNPCFAPLGGN